jgi:Domain of unknown function (DUF5680)
MDPQSIARLSSFLVEAKRRTYARLDDDATVSAPILPGSKQLEYREQELGYRDIYFGMAFFAGIEVVTAKERVIWSMSYAGGVSPGVTDRDQLLAIYAFLRQALLRVPEDRPFRGSSQFDEGDFRYLNASEGNISAFHGVEKIYRSGREVYALQYSGGIIR